MKVAVLKVNYCTKLSRLHCIKVNFHFLITFVLDRSLSNQGPDGAGRKARRRGFGVPIVGFSLSPLGG